jgi:hypothetical protein
MAMSCMQEFELGPEIACSVVTVRLYRLGSIIHEVTMHIRFVRAMEPRWLGFLRDRKDFMSIAELICTSCFALNISHVGSTSVRGRPVSWITVPDFPDMIWLFNLRH